MGRRPKPWYRKAADAWYVSIGGKQHRLAAGKANRAEADREFYRLMAGQGAPARVEDRTVAVLCDLFLDHAERAVRPRTYETYRRYIQSFVDETGDLAAPNLKPLHVSRWLAKHPGWGDSVRNVAIASVKRAFRWAEREGHIPTDPLRYVAKPPMKTRRRLLSPTEVAEMIAAVRDQPFRDFLTALAESGCRPGEATQVEARNVNLATATWNLEFKGNQDRVVYLTPTLLEITRRLMVEHPTGPLFRTRTGRPWTRESYGKRFRQLRRKLGLGEDVTAYLLRHAFVTDGLERGVPPATIAELAGHKNLNMIAKVYSKIREKKAHLSEAVRVVRPTADPPGEPSDQGPSGA